MIQFSKHMLIRSNHHPATTLKRLFGCVDAGRSRDHAIELCLGIFCNPPYPFHPTQLIQSSDENDATTDFGDLAFSFLADVTGLDDNGHIGKTAFAEDFGVTESKKVDDGSGVLRSTLGEVLLLGFLRKQAPKLCRF